MKFNNMSYTKKTISNLSKIPLNNLDRYLNYFKDQKFVISVKHKQMNYKLISATKVRKDNFWISLLNKAKATNDNKPLKILANV